MRGREWPDGQHRTARESCRGAAAFVGSYIAARLRQSVIIGYILAGLAIGPFTPGFVGDMASVQALADIGVIFLMFAIGVQLSLPDLVRVGRIALFGGAVQVVIMIAVGYAVGLALGWRPIEALFLGAVISRVLPRFFDRVAALRNQEVFVGMVAAVALGMAYLSSFFGLSVALGAFVAGVVVAESDLSHQILGEVRPLREIFSGMFFVAGALLLLVAG